MDFIVSQHKTRFAIGGSNVDLTDGMPVLPISALFLTIEATVAAANTLDSPLTLLQALKSIQFRFRGTQIWSLRGDDLYRIARALGLWASQMEATGFGAGARRILTLCLPFGRQLWSPTECFPGVNKGETELFTSWTAAPTGYTTLKYTLESLQLPDATPKNFLRCTTIGITPASTGDLDYDLPRAVPLMGIGYVQTNSEPANASPDIEKIKILANNRDTKYSLMSSMLARALARYDRQGGTDLTVFQSLSNTAGAYTQNALTANAVATSDPNSEFGWMDFDPLQDGNYLLDGRQFTDLKARITFNATNPIRLLPVEWWTPDMIGNKAPGK